MDLFTCLLQFKSSLLHLHVFLFILNFSRRFFAFLFFICISLFLFYIFLCLFGIDSSLSCSSLSYLCNLFSHFQFILVSPASKIHLTRFFHSCLRLFISIYNLCTPQISYFPIKFMPIFLVSVLAVYFNE